MAGVWVGEVPMHYQTSESKQNTHSPFDHTESDFGDEAEGIWYIYRHIYRHMYIYMKASATFVRSWLFFASSLSCLVHPQLDYNSGNNAKV